MRTLWNIVSFMAVVNLLAMLIFVGWMWHSDRLSRDRIDGLRDVFSMTVTDEMAIDAAEETAEADAEVAAVEAELMANPPLPSERRLQRTRMMQSEETILLGRVADETARRGADLEAAFARLAQERAYFEAQREAWEKGTAGDRDAVADEQFAKTVKMYETAPAKNAKLWLERLVQDGAMEQAVAYLNAMSPRATRKILALFKSDEDTALATELLERVRTFGVSEGAEDLGDADEPVDTSGAAQPS